MLTADIARQTWDYDPDTGRLYWKRTINSRAQAGARAGYLHKSWVTWALRYDGKLYHQHRIIWLMHHGRLPNADIGFRDGDGSNTRIENLYVKSYDSINNDKRRT